MGLNIVGTWLAGHMDGWIRPPVAHPGARGANIYVIDPNKCRSEGINERICIGIHGSRRGKAARVRVDETAGQRAFPPILGSMRTL